MALQSQITNKSGSGIQLNLGAADDAFVATGVIVASSDGNAIVGTGINHSVVVNGTVTAEDTTVALGDDLALDLGQFLRVGTTGSLAGFGNFAVTIAGVGSTIDNRGEIWGNLTAISISGNEGLFSTSSVIRNSGRIEAVADAINHTGSETLIVRNSGIIDSGQFAFFGFDGNETIINTGRMIGDIFFSGGADSYDGRSGVLEGSILGDAGADVLRAGAGSQTLGGGTGKDVLFGGAGKDSFQFVESFNAPNVDRIEDFSSKDDTIVLGTFVTGLALGKVSATQFTANASGKALDASDRLIFDTNDGQLLFDEDGKGGAVAQLIARFDDDARLAVADFQIVLQL